MADGPLHVDDCLAGIGFIPAPIEIFGRNPELDNEFVGEILRLDLAAFLLPEPQQSDFIVPIIIRASEPPMNVRRSTILGMRFMTRRPQEARRQTTVCMDLWTPSGAQL